MIRVATKPLIDILTDLARTSSVDGPTAGVLLHTARGYAKPGEPGKGDLLVGTSTSRDLGSTIGHTWIGASGKVPPMLWTLADTRNVIAVLKESSRGKKEHAVNIIRTGPEVHVAGDPELFEGETSLAFKAASLEDYPRDLWQTIGGTKVLVDDLETDEAPRTDIAPHTLDVLGRIGKRRGAAVRLFRTHQRRPILVQIGETYRGVVTPWRWDGDGIDDGHEPDADVYPPDMPTIA